MDQHKALRELPGIEKLVGSAGLKQWDAELVHPIRVKLAQELVDDLRAKAVKGEKVPPPEEIEKRLAARYEALLASGMRRVINATGVVLHTNLGRAPEGRARMAELASEIGGYCTLEFNTLTGERGSRGAAVERLLRLMCATDAAVVVNNNAAAFFLILHALVRGKGALISRGELVQIGGGFRVPDILAAAGVDLVEVGTTNMTAVKDFEKKLGSGHAIGAVLQVHQSNFVISGHTESPPTAKLAEVARKAGLPFVVDLGSGALLDEKIGEPTVDDILRAGADIVCFSGDKLLGGPQAGVIVGKKDLLQKMKESPVYRALRPPKEQLYLLERCLLGYCTGRPNATQTMMRAKEDELKTRAERIRGEIRGKIADAEVVPGESSLGGGTTPDLGLKTWLVAMNPPDAEAFVKRLLARRPAIVVRKENKRILVDPRTLLPDEEGELVRALVEAY